MSLLVWRQMNAYYALGSDGAHVYSVSCAHVRGVPTFHAWRRPSGDKPGESIGGAFTDEATAKRACQRDLDARMNQSTHHEGGHTACST